jgi:transcriptional regulator with XRE-family HTH domain
MKAPKKSSAGRVIRAVRESKKLTQAQLVDLLGKCWDCPRLSRLERGSKQLTPKTIIKFAEAFGMPPEQLHLMCLKEDYPSLKTTPNGRKLDEIVANLAALN